MLLTTNRTFNNKCNWCYTFKCKDKVMKYEDIKKYITDITDEIYSAQDVVNTGNFAIDGIFNYYAEKFRVNNIQCEINVVIPENISISTYDLNIIFGNLLDNALEDTVTSNIPKVTINIKYSEYTIYIMITNTYSEAVRNKNGRIISKKSGEHGYGIINVERVVEKYNGNMIIKYDNDIFKVMIAICDR